VIACNTMFVFFYLSLYKSTSSCICSCNLCCIVTLNR